MLCAVGDVHGQINIVADKIRELKLIDSKFLFAGDIGLGFRTIQKDIRFLSVINAEIAEDGNKFFLMRGNHDNPAYWDLSWEFDNIFFVKDNEFLELDGKRILFIGGAISVDRNDRVEGQTYWRNEMPFKRIPLTRVMDFVISHDAPISVGVTHMLCDNDSSITRDIFESRKTLQEIADSISFKEWIFGHHHSSTFNTIEGKVFRGLDICELHEIID